MSKAEIWDESLREMVEEHVNLPDARGMIAYYHRRSVQTHTSQTLQELKAKIEGLKYKDEDIAVYGDVCYNEALSEVLQLIEEIE